MDNIIDKKFNVHYYVVTLYYQQYLNTLKLKIVVLLIILFKIEGYLSQGVVLTKNLRNVSSTKMA